MPFTPAALRFFRQLATHNEKAWFEAHREEYELEVRAPMRELIEEMDVHLARLAPEIGGDPRRSMFRIHRDIRFSKDKSPYKTNAACWFYHRGASRGVGTESSDGSAGFYFHLQPGKSFVGGGLWMPSRPQLTRLRTAIADDPTGFERAVRALPKRYGGLSTESMLTRMPRGYPDSHPAAQWLRYQSFTSGRPVTDVQATSRTLPKLLARDFEGMVPLVRWLNGALGYRAASVR